jgi:phosphotransferase system IIB component
MVKQTLKYHEQTLEHDSTKRFTIKKRSDGTVWDGINITSCAVVDTCIRFAVNNTQLIIIDDIVETKNKLTLYKEDNTAVFVDMSMIKANMEKLLDD